MRHGGAAVETQETKNEAELRLEGGGYKIVGKKRRTLPKIQDAAKIYAIELGNEVYIGKTEMNINSRMISHINSTDTPKAREMLENGAIYRIVEFYKPGEWTWDGILQREREMIAEFPNTVNIAGVE